MREIRSAFVTGATGAVGSALVRGLAENGVRVTVLCRPDSKRAANLPRHPLVSVCEGDVTRLCDVHAEETFDAFFHLAWMGTTGAARNDMHLQNENVRCALDAADLAARLGCRVFVGAGSQAEYGRVEGKLTAETPAFPENGYGIAKLCAGQMTRIACAQHGVAHVWARILSVYGPCDNPNSLVMSVIGALLRGERPQCTKGEQMWNYLYAADAARALLAMAKRGADGAVYPLGGGTAKPLKNYILAIRDAVDPALGADLGALAYPDRQVMYLCADLEELTRDTGFVPQVPFERGIRETVAWVKGRMQQ